MLEKKPYKLYYYLVTLISFWLVQQPHHLLLHVLRSLQAWAAAFSLAAGGRG